MDDVETSADKTRDRWILQGDTMLWLIGLLALMVADLGIIKREIWIISAHARQAYSATARPSKTDKMLKCITARMVEAEYLFFPETGAGAKVDVDIDDA